MIRDESNASGDKAERGILNNFSPLPLKKEPLCSKTLAENSALSVPSNLKPNVGDTEAVTEPLLIEFISNANAVSGISNKSLPLPLNTLPLLSLILADISALSVPSNLNP